MPAIIPEFTSSSQGETYEALLKGFMNVTVLTQTSLEVFGRIVQPSLGLRFTSCSAESREKHFLASQRPRQDGNTEDEEVLRSTCSRGH